MELQEDALIEILARLPVKSLIRFTCVCKYWLSLIKSPEFAAKQYATRETSDDDHDCFLATCFPACSISIFCYHNMAFQTAFKGRPAVAYEPPPRFGIAHREIITECFICGPCNGLFLLKLLKGLYDRIVVLLLWNPATREVFRVPDNDYDCNVVGLGFDHVVNDYKVVNFNGHDAKSSIVRVYSLAANKWRQVDAGLYIDVMTKTVHQNYSSLTGRKNHFLAIAGNMDLSLVSFDMVDELFVETALPDGLATGRLWFDGFLYRGSNHEYPTIYSPEFKPMRTTQDPVEMHIWVLNGYGPTGVWNKQQSIVVPFSVGDSPQLMLWKNTDIVFGDRADGAITSYNLTTQEMKSLRIPGDLDLIGYTESVLSIAGFGPGGLMQDHSSTEIGPRGVHNHSSVEIQENPEEEEEGEEEEEDDEDEDDDDDDSSTDSAFLMLEGPSMLDNIVDFYDSDLNLYPYRQMECERLCKLPYVIDPPIKVYTRRSKHPAFPQTTQVNLLN